MHSCVTYFITVSFKKDTHSSISNHLVIIVIDIFNNFVDFGQPGMIFMFGFFLIVIVTGWAYFKFSTKPPKPEVIFIPVDKSIYL